MPRCANIHPAIIEGDTPHRPLRVAPPARLLAGGVLVGGVPVVGELTAGGPVLGALGAGVLVLGVLGGAPGAGGMVLGVLGEAVGGGLGAFLGGVGSVGREPF